MTTYSTTEHEQEVAYALSEEEAARITLGPGGPGSLWAHIIQVLIDKGADMEFFYDTAKQQMDFTLRNTDKLIYNWEEGRYIQFTWRRYKRPFPYKTSQGIHCADKLIKIDFIEDGQLERHRRRLKNKFPFGFSS